MPPALATLLCAVFIPVLLYANWTRNRGLSWTVWVPTIWAALLASRPLGSLMGSNQGLNFNTAADGSPIDRNVTSLLILLGLAILAKRGVQLGRFVKDNRWLCIFYLYLLLSVLWSDYPFVAFKRLFRDVASVVMILVILTEADQAEAVRQVFVRCAYLCIPLSILTMKYYPVIGIGYNEWTGESSFCGITSDKNALGRLAMVSGLFLIWSLSLTEGLSWFKRIRERWFDAAVLVLCLMILAKANSQTSLFCIALGTFVFLVVQTKWIKASEGRLLGFGCLLITLSIVFFSVPDLRGIVTGALHRNVNLTERTDVWKGCLGLGTDPLIGTGFDSVWLTPAAIKLGNKLQVEEAHNGYLETYLNTGLIGDCLLLAVLVAAGKNAARHVIGNSATGPLYASLFLVGVIYNYTEAAFDNGSLVGFMLWVVAIQYQTATEPVALETLDETSHSVPGPASSFGMLLRKD